MAGSAGANLINFLRLRKYCTWSFTWRFSWQQHFLPILVLFANSLVNLLYVSAYVAQLGVMTSDYYYVGLYSVAGKVTALLKQLLGAVIIVTVPRLACLYGQKVGLPLAQREKAGQWFAGLSLCLLGLPSCFG